MNGFWTFSLEKAARMVEMILKRSFVPTCLSLLKPWQSASVRVCIRARVRILHELNGGWHRHKFAHNSCCIKLIGIRNSNYSIPLGKMILPFSWVANINEREKTMENAWMHYPENWRGRFRRHDWKLMVISVSEMSASNKFISIWYSHWCWENPYIKSMVIRHRRVERRCHVHSVLIDFTTSMSISRDNRFEFTFFIVGAGNSSAIHIPSV